MAKRGTVEWKQNISSGHLNSTVARKGGMLGRTVRPEIEAIREPTMRELGWAAGFLEGEGNFTTHGDKGGEIVRVSHVDPDPLSLLQQIFGGRVKRVTRPSNENPNWSHYWHWEIYGSRARGVMMTLYPLFSTKRQTQIEEALKDAA